jgi:hypothetical protein
LRGRDGGGDEAQREARIKVQDKREASRSLIKLLQREQQRTLNFASSPFFPFHSLSFSSSVHPEAT